MLAVPRSGAAKISSAGTTATVITHHGVEPSDGVE
jgi:hypothetical protein